MKEIIERIAASSLVLLVSHNRPDGDAIGSLVGLGLLLEGAGKTVRMVNADPVPESLHFLPCQDRVELPGDSGGFDLMISLDSAGRDRIADEVWEMGEGLELINIDHHISNNGYGDLNFVDSSSPATGQIVYQLAKTAGWKVTPDIAENLYAAISTDTGSFKYPSTTADTYRIIGELVDCGVDVGRVNQDLYESFPLRRVEAMQQLLAGMRLDFGGRCASVRLPMALTKALELQTGDTEGVIDVIRAIEGVTIAVFFEDLPDGKIRVSSRSKSDAHSVGEICSQFGGGGHTLAAGARLPGPMEKAVERFLAAVGQSLERD